MKQLFSAIFLIASLSQLCGQKFPDSNIDGKYYNINGAKIWTVSHGHGDPLFIIAGGPGGAHVGMRPMDSLAETSTLVYYDAFGRGKSDQAKNVEEYTIDRDVRDLEELRKAMGFSKINIFGHSYGSVVAQGYACAYPDKVSHLILAGPFHSHVAWQKNDDNSNHEFKTNYPEAWDTLIKVRSQGYQSSDSIHQAIYSRMPYGFVYAYNPENFVSRGSAPYPNRFNSALYYQMVGPDGDFLVGSDIGSFDFREKLKDLKMPILVMGGRFDRVAVPEMVVQYKKYCPQARVEIFEKSGHNTFIEEKAKTFSMITEFLAK